MIYHCLNIYSHYLKHHGVIVYYTKQCMPKYLPAYITWYFSLFAGFYGCSEIGQISQRNGSNFSWKYRATQNIA